MGAIQRRKKRARKLSKERKYGSKKANSVNMAGDFTHPRKKSFSPRTKNPE